MQDFPTSWKTVFIIPVPKPGKVLSDQSFIKMMPQYQSIVSRDEQEIHFGIIKFCQYHSHQEDLIAQISGSDSRLPLEPVCI